MFLSVWAMLLISKVGEILFQSDKAQTSAYVYLRRSNFNCSKYPYCCIKKDTSRLKYETTWLHPQLLQVDVASQRSYTEGDRCRLQLVVLLIIKCLWHMKTSGSTKLLLMGQPEERLCKRKCVTFQGLKICAFFDLEIPFLWRQKKMFYQPEFSYHKH